MFCGQRRVRSRASARRAAKPVLPTAEQSTHVRAHWAPYVHHIVHVRYDMVAASSSHKRAKHRMAAPLRPTGVRPIQTNRRERKPVHKLNSYYYCIRVGIQRHTNHRIKKNMLQTSGYTQIRTTTTHFVNTTENESVSFAKHNSETDNITPQGATMRSSASSAYNAQHYCNKCPRGSR